jgi:hypothetical protein
METDKPKVPGIKAMLYFLLREGQIRVETVVRHSVSGIGLGLKFLAVSEQDRPQPAVLMTRLRGLSHYASSRPQLQF